MGKKQFIDKKNARVFRLVDRSVMDDHATHDDEGNPLPDRVFVDVTPGNHPDDEVEEFDDEDQLVDIGSDELNLYKYFILNNISIYYSAEIRAGEAAKYGIFYDDRQYDYTQHLKPIGQAPGAVFMSAPGATVEHDSAGEPVLEAEDPLTALNAATYSRILETDADPAVKEVLEALEDDAFIDEDDFDDDFIVKLDREEVRVLAEVKPAGRRAKSSTGDLDKDFEKILQMYDQDDEEYGEDFSEYSVEEFYESEDDEDASVDVVGIEDAKPFSRGGPSRMYQVDEVRRELRDGDAALLERILYTTDDENESGDEIIEVDAEELDKYARVALNCQTACQFLSSASNRKIIRPKLIVEASGEPSVKAIRISRKTGMPVNEDEYHQQQQSSEDDGPAVNKGEARPKEETAEEKHARKAAVKEEKRLKRISKKAYA